MSSLLYYSISSGLTDDKIIEIDKRVAKDRELAYLFIKNLPSNSKDKTKRLFLYVMFLFQLGQPLVPYAAAVVMPLSLAIQTPTQMERNISQFILSQDDHLESIKDSSSPSVHRLLKITGGNQNKTGAGARAMSDARRAASKSRKSYSKVRRPGHRRLFIRPAAPNAGRPRGVFSYKTPPSLEDNRPKPGKGPRVTKIAGVDENGETTTTYYNQDGLPISEEEFYLLNEKDLASNESTNLADQQIQSETKTQTKEVNSKKSGLTKARERITPVNDEKLTDEGDLVSPSQSKVTSQGRSFIDQTKERRASPLLQSKYEDRDEGFFPAYGPKQLRKKNYHTVEVLDELDKNVSVYTQLPESKQLLVDCTIVENLLAHPDTELYMNVIGQGREPIALVLNRGQGNYSLQNHIGIFERRPEAFDYNSYISNYLAKDKQIENFDLTNSTVITYEDLLGNLHTNTGPVFGKTNSPTVSPTGENVTSDNSDSNPEL